MTSQEINRLSAPVVQAYRDMEDELLRLIARQIAKDGRLSDTSKWRIRQLARAGEVNRQALNIIDSYSGGISAEVYDAILAAAEGEVGRLDAAMMNLLSEKGRMTEDVQESLDAFERQSRQELNVRNAEIAEGYASALSERCNLVNTVMGYSVKSAYSQAVRDISAEVDRQSVLDTLNQGAASVVSGNMGLQEATRKAIHKLAEKGLPGFTDKAGRQWSPEAYVRMDLRSTMGNTARAAQDARCDAYGIDLIEVSSHLGARPKCAPYQGRIFSRDGSRGITEDLNGGRIEYTPLSETSYGEPDGLFGINCGHQQYPFIPGVSLKTYYPYDEAENAKRYEDTQRQRALERKIRADKRECMMLQEAGDKEGLQKAAGQLRADKDRYRDFCKEKGLGAHNENTQVFGYDHSKSMKTVWAEKKGLTGGSNGGIINKDSSFDFYPVSERALNGKLMVDAFEDVRLNEDISTGMHDILSAVKDHVPGTEAGLLIPIGGGKRSDIILGDEGGGTIKRPGINEPYVSIHNHASGETLSADDVKRLITHKDETGAFVVGNNGNIYGVIKSDNFDWMNFQMQIIDRSYEDVVKELKENGMIYGLQYYQKLFE